MPDSRTLARFSPTAAILFLAAGATSARAASIGLTGFAVDPVVISGGSTTLQATVTNTGASGSGDLSYDITFAAPGGPYQSSDTLAPGDSQTWQAPYDSTGQPYGLNLSTVSVTDPNASNDPQSIQIGVTVLAHAAPFLSTGSGPLLGLDGNPPVDFLAFGATGGGETFAAYSLAIVNDPPFPTAGLDLDSFYTFGDPQITTDLTTFGNLAPNDDPAYGHLFSITVDTTHPGTFTKTFYLNFSDQDLPGASASGSVADSFTVVATVVPEPATVGLLALGLAGLGGARRLRPPRRGARKEA